MQRILEDIKDHAQRMEDSGEVDLSILEKIKTLKTKVIEMKDKWVRYDNSDGFYFYLAVRNVELVLDKMEERFNKASENKDNPQIAVDTMTILPFVDNIIQMTDASAIKKEDIDIILRHTHNIMDEAEQINLISDNNNSISLSKRELGEVFDKVMENIGIPAKFPTLDELDENPD